MNPTAPTNNGTPLRLSDCDDMDAAHHGEGLAKLPTRNGPIYIAAAAVRAILPEHGLANTPAGPMLVPTGTVGKSTLFIDGAPPQTIDLGPDAASDYIRATIELSREQGTQARAAGMQREPKR